MLNNQIPEASLNWLNKSKKFLGLALDEIRNISHRLAPSFFDEKTIEETFQELLINANPEGKYETNLHIDFKQIKHRLNSDIELNLYRIIQEQLRNIQKYAQASQISVSLRLDGEYLLLKVEDNGVGFDFSKIKKGIGLANIRRRAELFSGTMEIDSKPGEGCRLIIRIPPIYN
jgi:signal transduction histidine kinase